MDPPPGRFNVPPRKDSSSSGALTSPIDGTSWGSSVLRSRRLSKEERKNSYDRIEILTKELTLSLKDEMARRKDAWDVDGDREEEEQWESRKQEIYDGLSELTGEIKRALRDRNKEAVLDLWGKEMEERRVQRNGGSRRDGGGEIDGEEIRERRCGGREGVGGGGREE